jgi:hypothetical protein
MFPFLMRAASVVAILILCVGCSALGVTERTALVERVEEAKKSLEGGQFPAFVDEPKLVDVIDLGSAPRRCLTPPFPSRLSFGLEIPTSGFLDFSTAVVMSQDIRRARVEYVVMVEADGRTERVYSEVFRSHRSNEWHDRRIDLTRWSDKRVQLTLEVRAVPARGNILWAERLQTVWGEPVLFSSPWSHLDARMREALVGFGIKLGKGAESHGVGPEQQIMTLRFAINLLIGGLLAMFVRELYKRYGTTRTHRARFAKMLPLFTITTTAVVFVVQFSPALSLGLIGALSIVRFRAAITSTEELSYLLLAVALGAVLGASHVLLALGTVAVVTPFIMLRSELSSGTSTSDVLLTMTGPPEKFFSKKGPSVIDILKKMTNNLTIHRLEHEPDRVICRARATIENRAQTMKLLHALSERATHCQISNLDGDTVAQ